MGRGDPAAAAEHLLDLQPGHTDADVEVPGGIGHVALRSQRV
jgi:hypothetical protein